MTAQQSEAAVPEVKATVKAARRIYVASSWRNALQPGIVVALRSMGHEVYDFRNPNAAYANSNPEAHGFHWSEIDGGWQNWDLAAYRQALQSPIAEQGFRSDWEAMEWANTCVLVLPCGRSAHLEAGYFVGAGKDLHILLPEKQEPELMYRMATSISLSLYELLGAVER